MSEPGSTTMTETLLRAKYADQPGVLAALKLHREVEAAWKPGVWICEECYNRCHSRSGLMCEEPSDAVYPCDTIKALAAPFADDPDFQVIG